jgi:hypothetical protein
MTGSLAMIISAIVMAARDAAADIEHVSADADIAPDRARALKSLADNLYAIAHQAEENDPEAVRFLCDMLGLETLLAEYDAELEARAEQ